MQFNDILAFFIYIFRRLIEEHDPCNNIKLSYSTANHDWCNQYFSQIVVVEFGRRVDVLGGQA